MMEMNWNLEKKVRDYKELLERDNNIYIPRNDLGFRSLFTVKNGKFKDIIELIKCKKETINFKKERKKTFIIIVNIINIIIISFIGRKKGDLHARNIIKK